MKQLKTRWTDGIDPEHVLEEYPRPNMRRASYINLNGRWEYAFTDRKECPAEFDGEILVPFSPEAPLSGVGRQLKPREYLWYQRMLPEEVRPEAGKRWLLHFGAVDQYAVVWVNGRLAGKHLGGYLPFTLDVTGFLRTGENCLRVLVRDYSERSFYSRGKQKLRRGGMFYTAQSGIWQTVWMEQVPETYIRKLRMEPLYDDRKLRVTAYINVKGKLCGEAAQKAGKETDGPLPVEITVSSPDMQPVCVSGEAGKPVEIWIPDSHSWTPEDPYLYDLEVTAGEDRVESYAALRKISVEKDGKGIPRIFLNGQPYFQKGLLDQGYWPDGLYTPPCDEAMIYDIETAKKLGFNMLRKHIKIEPQRWYYHCDRLGMLVWQDMVNGGRDLKSWYVTYLATAMEVLHIRPGDHMLWLLGRQDARGRKQFVGEMRGAIRQLYNHPSIVCWVIFNEGWGQFHAGRVTDIAREEDGSRLLDQASGWFDQGGGDLRSIHDYFFPLRIRPERRATALTEFGGYSWAVRGHRMYRTEYGYRLYRSRRELTRGYRELFEREILPNIPKGLSATIYTQLTDIEEEVNGMLTYDRELVKLEEDVVQELNARCVLADSV